jgi:hypothetical protein
MIRGHAYWALGRGFGDRDRLRAALDRETVPEARDELILALLMVEQPDAYDAVLVADEQARGDGQVRGLALIGPHAAAEGTGQEPELAFIDAEGRGMGLLEEPIVRVYDPDRAIERARQTIRSAFPMQSVTYS